MRVHGLAMVTPGPLTTEGVAMAETRGAFDEWVEPHLATLRRLAVALVGFADADDVVQDALLRAWQRWSTYDERRGTPREWLLGIVRDRARGLWRRRARAPRTDLEPTGVEEPSVEGRLDLRQAVESLPRRQREAVWLYYYVDLSIDEVATVLGCSPGTVKSALFDARRNLAKETS